MRRDEVGGEVFEFLVDVHGGDVIWLGRQFPEPPEYEQGALQIGVFVLSQSAPGPGNLR